MTLWDYNNAQFSPGEAVWFDCSECGGDGYIDGECTCGEDCCCCLEPDAPTCGWCGGKGGWRVANGREVNDAEETPCT